MIGKEVNVDSWGVMHAKIFFLKAEIVTSSIMVDGYHFLDWTGSSKVI